MRGRVVGPGGSALAGVVVQAAATTGAHPDSASARSTDDAGEFCIVVRGGAEYVFRVEKADFVARAMLVQVPRDGGVALGDVQLAPATAYQLEAVLVQAPRRAPQSTRRGAPAGSRLVSLSGSQAGAYPGAAGDLSESAGVSGAFVPVRGQDLSIEGQSPSGNRTTLDGSGFDSREVPAEALGAAGVFAHPYDVSRGQFTGGEIAGRTLGGTNLWGGGVRGTLGPQWLASGRGPQGSWGSNARRALLSGGGGGPLLPGRLFVYGAMQATQRTAEAPGLHPSTAALPAYGIPGDSLQRFFSVLQGLGLNAYGGGVMRRSQSVTALTRFDLLAGEHHAFMLRLDGRDRTTEGGAGTQLSTAAAARDRTSGAGVLLQATSRDPRGENTFQASRSWSTQRIRSDARLPAAEVWVAAADAAGLPSAGASLAFGGDPFSRPDETRGLWSVEDRLEVRAGAAHRITLGAAWQVEDVSLAQTGDLGRFSYASLADVEAGRPTRFTRALGADSLALGTRYLAGFLGDQWKHGAHLRAVAGVRVERYGYARRAAGTELTGTPWQDLRATPAPSGWGVSPRAGVSWFRVTGSSEFALQGGSGIFRGAAPTRALAARLLGASRRLECIGDDVPVPGWSDYQSGTAAVPSACLNEAGPAAT
ncbi:MAG TPA: TonB-dependent receptor, partial [Longimicrobiaceae bacterium]|nr:TonB-dependent receptor [Longimicrobiaceae bacterium]